MKENSTVLKDFIDTLLEDLDPNLPIKEARAGLVTKIGQIYDASRHENKAFLFEPCVNKQTKWSRTISVLGLKTYVADELDAITLEGLKHVSYKLLLINVDSIFYQLDQLIKHVRSEGSQNKNTSVFLITYTEAHLSQLEGMTFDKNTILLSERKAIEETEEAQNAPA